MKEMNVLQKELMIGFTIQCKI
uniref:Uncharacterized protein n=1 Tax=Tetranychus urticae TaxID=32264 RepID=T1K3Z4_TETUR